MCSFSVDLVPLPWNKAEEVTALIMADEKPHEGVKTENNDHINLKQQADASVMHFKKQTPPSESMKAYCEWQGLLLRYKRFWFDG